MVTVLVVDDDPSVRKVTARALRWSGYAAAEAADGREAWNYLRRPGVAVDVVVCDVVMPEMTGRELAALLRKTRPSLPVILMTGYEPDDLSVPGAEDATVPLLRKPFEPDRLVALIEQCLSDAQSKAS
jgi:two-component system cell cycle sensor histidine kinase/response regulator CckA